MKNVYFGFACQYDTGMHTSVTMDENGVIVEVHKSENADTLWCHVGDFNKATVDWGGSVQYDTGDSPSVAMNDSGVVVEVHRSSSETKLWYHVGRLSDGTVNWSVSRQYSCPEKFCPIEFTYPAIANKGLKSVW